MLRSLRDLNAARAWDLLLLAVFIPGSAWWAFIVLIQPAGLGSHANIYTDAAAAWLRGGDPWVVGPPAAVFAGPPTMLLPFLPFAALSVDMTRIVWFVADLVLAAWAIRRLGLPAYWLAFPPLFSAIILGHIEILVLCAIVVGGTLSGLAAVVKPYAVLPLIAERRWRAIALAAVVVALTFPLLPWQRFFSEFQMISSNLARQNTGDSAFGQPLPMLLAAVALIAIGPRRALWLAAPVLWPYSQAIYKTMTLPALTPVVALFWALPIAGSTLLGVVALAVLVTVDRRWKLPSWLRAGIEPAARNAATTAPRSVPAQQLVPA